jgi:hypothetical protein
VNDQDVAYDSHDKYLEALKIALKKFKDVVIDQRKYDDAAPKFMTDDMKVCKVCHLTLKAINEYILLLGY